MPPKRGRRRSTPEEEEEEPIVIKRRPKDESSSPEPVKKSHKRKRISSSPEEEEDTNKRRYAKDDTTQEPIQKYSRPRTTPEPTDRYSRPEPEVRKKKIQDPNKKYKMTAAQWACTTRNLLIFDLCDPDMQYFRECGGAPNVCNLICDPCTILNHKRRFPDSEPLKPLPPFPTTFQKY